MLNYYMKYMRKSRNMTQKELAKKLYIAPCTLSHYETGSRMVPHSVFLRALEICDYTLKVIDNTTTKYISEEDLKRITVEQ